MVQVIRENPMRSGFLVGVIFLAIQVGLVVQTTRSFNQSRPLDASDFLPYGNVEVLMAEYKFDDQGNWRFRFIANFEKFGCDIETYRVVALLPGGVRDSVTVEDAGNFGDLVKAEKEQMLNRTTGFQTINQWWDLPPDFEEYEIRTSHLCPRKDHPERVRVPLVFYTGDNSTLIVPGSFQDKLQNKLDQSSAIHLPFTTPKRVANLLKE